jgi:hypothetical protein
MMPDSVFEDEMKKVDYWLNELRSLGISARKKNELNDRMELHNLADKIKEQLYQEYKAAFA